MMDKSDFDETCIRALIEDLGEDLGHEILGVFFSATGGDLDFLCRIECEDNRNLIRSRARSIDSAAVAFGFNLVSRLARELETDAATVSAPDFETRVAALNDAFIAARSRISR